MEGALDRSERTASASVFCAYITARIGQKTGREESLDYDPADRQTSDYYRDAYLHDRPDLRGIVVVSHIFEVDFDDVGYSDYADNYITGGEC